MRFGGMHIVDAQVERRAISNRSTQAVEIPQVGVHRVVIAPPWTFRAFRTDDRAWL